MYKIRENGDKNNQNSLALNAALEPKRKWKNHNWPVQLKRKHWITAAVSVSVLDLATIHTIQ